MRVLSSATRPLYKHIAVIGGHSYNISAKKFTVCVWRACEWWEYFHLCLNKPLTFVSILFLSLSLLCFILTVCVKFLWFSVSAESTFIYCAKAKSVCTVKDSNILYIIKFPNAKRISFKFKSVYFCDVLHRKLRIRWILHLCLTKYYKTK